MIRIDNAGHWFRPDHWLFRNLSFVLVPSEVTAILGPNGVGKTTLLRAVCGTLSLREGAVNADAQIGYAPLALHADHAYSAIDMVLLGRSRYLDRRSGRRRPGWSPRPGRRPAASCRSRGCGPDRDRMPRARPTGSPRRRPASSRRSGRVGELQLASAFPSPAITCHVSHH